MRFSCDRTGFPLVELPDVGLRVGLLPVLKVQFEMYLAEAAAHGDEWYEEVLRVGSRASWRTWTGADRASLFMTGVLPDEAMGFARWLGAGFRLPTVAEWRAVFGALDRDLRVDRFPRVGGDESCHVLSVLWRTEGRAARGSRLCCMSAGIYEWADDRGDAVLVGAPEFSPLADPCEVSTPTRRDLRGENFGFRVVAPFDEA